MSRTQKLVYLYTCKPKKNRFDTEYFTATSTLFMAFMIYHKMTQCKLMIFGEPIIKHSVNVQAIVKLLSIGIFANIATCILAWYKIHDGLIHSKRWLTRNKPIHLRIPRLHTPQRYYRGDLYKLFSSNNIGESPFKSYTSPISSKYGANTIILAALKL